MYILRAGISYWRKALPLICIAWTACGILPLPSFSFVKNNSLHQNGLHLMAQPDEIPNLLPKSIYYPKAALKWAALYVNDPFFSSDEGALIFESSASQEAIKNYYLKVIRSLGWQLIQRQQQAQALLLMTESPQRRLLTIVLRGSQPTSIKLYTRLIPLH